MNGVSKANFSVGSSIEISLAKSNEITNPSANRAIDLSDVLKNWVKGSINSGGGSLPIEEKRDILVAIKALEESLKEISASVMKVSVFEAPKVSIDANVPSEKKVVRKSEGVQKTILGSLNSGKAKNIGLFGVTANPPHRAHCEVIKFALKTCDEVWVSPVFMHPFGKKPIPYNHRLALLEFIIEDFFHDLSDLRRIRIVEVDKEFVEKFEKIPYSYDLLSHLREVLPQNHYSLVIGEDNYKPDVWQRFHKYREIEEEFDLVIAKDLGVHSTEIRESFADLDEEALAAFCLPQAASYLKKHRFW